MSASIEFIGPHAETKLICYNAEGGSTTIPLTPDEIKMLDDLMVAVGKRKGVI